MNTLPPVDIKKVQKAFSFNHCTYQEGIEKEYNNEEILQYDGLHLSEMMQKVLAKEIFPQIYKMLIAE